MPGSIVVSSSGTRTVPAKVVEFAGGTAGNVAPIRSVGGPSQSRLVTASGITEDADGFLYVAAPVIRSLLVFSPEANGDTPPFAVLAGASPGLTNPQGIAIGDQKLYVANGPFGPGAPGIPSVAVFALPLAPGAHDVGPVAVIGGSATGLDSPFGLALDSSGNIYVANLNNTVTVYAPPAASSYLAPHNMSPVRTISDGLAGPEGLAIKDDTLYVSNDDNTIATYSLPSGTRGAVIGGPATRLNQPLGIDVDSSGTVFVVNTENEVLAFGAGASGNAAPIAIITGPATELISPQFVLAALGARTRAGS